MRVADHLLLHAAGTRDGDPMKSAGNVVYLVDDDPRVREGLKNLFDSVEISMLTFGSAADYLGH